MTSDSPRRRVTAADVAEAAGVSATTVSYVLNNRPHQSIPDHTRARVVETAARLGYAPSPAARMLATGRSGLVLGLQTDWPIGHNAGQFIRRITAAFAERGYVYLVHTAVSGDVGDALNLVWRTITPAAVLTFEDLEPAAIQRMKAAGVTHIVQVWSQSGLGTGIFERWERCVGEAQAQHLIAAGHRQIGYAWPEDERLLPFANPRLAGVRSACAAAGLAPPDVRTVSLSTNDHALAAVEAWRAQQPAITAICAYNDEIAIATLQALRQYGLTAPDDLAIIGVDDLPTSALEPTPLSSINYDRTGIADIIAGSVHSAILSGQMSEPELADFVHVIRRTTS